MDRGSLGDLQGNAMSTAAVGLQAPPAVEQNGQKPPWSVLWDRTMRQNVALEGRTASPLVDIFLRSTGAGCDRLSLQQLKVTWQCVVATPIGPARSLSSLGTFNWLRRDSEVGMQLWELGHVRHSFVRCWQCVQLQALLRVELLSGGHDEGGAWCAHEHTGPHPPL